MDANGQNHEGFSQDECVEWVENKSVDLRQLARSPHIPVTPALLSTETTSSHKDRKAQETPDTSELVKQLNKNYSPKQEVNNILDTLKGDSEESAHNAPTQPHENVSRMATMPAPLGMRHRRRHRETSTAKKAKKLKRTATPNAGRGRGRPRTSESVLPMKSGVRPVTTGGDQADFESLLKELDRPDTTPRVPLHPAKVNMPVRGESSHHKAVTKLSPLKEPQKGNRSGLSSPCMTAHAAPKHSIAQTISNPYPKRPDVLVKPMGAAAIARNDDVRSREVQNMQIMRPDVLSKPPSNAAAQNVQNVDGRERQTGQRRHPAVLTMTPSNVATQSIGNVNNWLGQYRTPAFTDATLSAPKQADDEKLNDPHPPKKAPAPLNSQRKMVITVGKNVQNRPERLTDAMQSVPNEANATKLLNPCPQQTAPLTVPVNPPKKIVIEAENNVQNRRLPADSSIAAVQAAAERAKGPPAAKVTDLLSASPFIGDELELSEEDWAKMDALTSKAESRVSKASPVKNESYSTTDWNTIQALDETLVRSLGHPSVSETITTADAIRKKEEFDDFPMFDFDDLDKQIAQRSYAVASNPGTTFDLPGTVRTAPSPDVPVRNPVVPTFDPKNSFIAFSRYKVVRTEVDNNTYTTTLFVKEWSAAMLEEKEQQSIHRPSTLERFGSLSRSDADQQRADGCIFLRGEWYHTRAEADALVHLCSLSGKYRTDLGALPVVLHTNPPHGSNIEDDLVLVVHPDRLIPPTAISETVSCSRRAILQLRLGSTGLSSKAALFGTMRHELFERCMSNQDFNWPTTKLIVQNIVRRNAESLVGCGVTDAEAREEVLRVVPQIQRFAANFTSFTKRQRQPSASNAYGSRLKGNGIQPDIHFVANSVQATEESIVCPELGLKGYLDVTVSAMTHPLSSTVGHQASKSVLQPQTSLASIELKTGHNQNPQNAHMAQLALYTMMLRVRRGPQTRSSSIAQEESQQTRAGESGMLLYLNHEAYRALHVSPMPNEIKSLIGQRNLVASELSKASRPRGVILNYDEGTNNEAARGIDIQDRRGPRVDLLPASPAVLPEVLATSHACSRCYANRECMTYAAAEMKTAPTVSFVGVDKSHGKLLHRFTGHLSQEDLQYFQDWDRLIDLEADASTFMPTTAWLRCSQDQEKASGKCLSSMILDEASTMMANASDPDTANDHRSALIVLERSKDSALTTPLSRLNIESGSPVIISSDATTLHLSSSMSDTPLTGTCRGDHRFRHRMSIVRGVTDSVDQKRITIRASRDELKQLRRLNQEYVESHPSSSNRSSSSGADGILRFRVDKDDVSTGIGTLRQNLIQLLTSDAQPTETNDAKAPVTQPTTDLVSARRDRLSWLRDVIIRLRSPSFDETLRTFMFDSSRSSRSGHHPAAESEFFSLVAEFSELNGDQRNAVEKIMCAKDYALIQGLPGTGKTSTIAFVVRLLAAHGKRILITSYTHAAVDNLMLKLMESGVASTSGNLPPPLVRVGRKSACHPSVHSILVPTIAAAKDVHRGDGNGDCVHDLPSPDSLSDVISSAQIVGVSALTVPRSSLLIGQHFDIVIVDEAGQISQPAILGALMAADSFVLVGDHMQLPPLVTSEVAEKGGYNVSMLKRLADKHPSSVAQLTLQYRMHGAICQLCNDIVYGGKLRCANEEVETSLLRLPAFPSAILKHAVIDPIACWMTDVIDPSQPVVFVDTDSIRSQTANSQSAITLPSLEGAHSLSTTFGLERTTGKKGKGNVVNDTEAVLVRQVVHGLLECGMETSQIGVICPFRSQLRLLDQNQSMEAWKAKGLELSTIDRYQGRDKSAIVISFVRSNTSGNAGRLLEDFRRLNVAVSRAKRKLVMIGSFTTLEKGSDVLRPVLQNMRRRNQIVELPEDALQRYRMT